MAIPLNKLLSWASKGLHIFPLSPGSKIPYPNTSGCSEATTDPEQITTWSEKYPDANWGLNAGASGLAIVDVDLNKPGAAEAYEAIKDRLPATFTVDTPSGGMHLYYRGTCANSVNKLGRGVDTRGVGGYVVMPGSSFEGKQYRVRTPAAISSLPDWVNASLGARAAVEPERTPVAELDTPDAIIDAARYLQHEAKPAIEGQGGDMTTLATAARLKDLGVSQTTAVALMAQWYNPRCAPAWDLSELARKVANAYTYGKNAPGSARPEAIFQPIPEAEPERPLIHAITADTIDVSTIPARPWVLGRDYISGFITGTVAPGGLGKSTLCVVEAIGIAVGKPLTGSEVFKQGATWIYNTEDPLDELQRRVAAAAAHYSLAREDLKNIHISSGRSSPLILAKSERGVVAVNEPIIAAVIAYIKLHSIRLWCVDPFVHTHYCEENSNAEIAIVMAAFGRIAEATGCAISLVHHTTKGSGGAGDMDKARGASAFGGAVRVMRTVTAMSEEDASRHGMKERDRFWFFWLDGAKNNMAMPDDTRRAFRRVSIELPNGDNVGCVEPVMLQQVASEDVKAVQEAVIDRARCGQYLGHWSTLDEVVVDIKGADDVGQFKGLRATTLQAKVKEAFNGAPVGVPNTDLRIKVENRDGKWMLTAEAGAFQWLDE